MAEHQLIMTDRREISLTGVKDVSEFSENRVVLKTSMGGLCIKGKKLTISWLNTDTGELNVSGEAELIKYTSAPQGKGLIEGLFK